MHLKWKMYSWSDSVLSVCCFHSYRCRITNVWHCTSQPPFFFLFVRLFSLSSLFFFIKTIIIDWTIINLSQTLTIKQSNHRYGLGRCKFWYSSLKEKNIYRWNINFFHSFYRMQPARKRPPIIMRKKKKHQHQHQEHQ